MTQTKTDPIQRIIASYMTDKPGENMPDEMVSALSLLDIARSLREANRCPAVHTPTREDQPMTDRPARLAEIPAESTTEFALLDIATSLRTIANALTSIDQNGVDTYSPRPPAQTASYQERH